MIFLSCLLSAGLLVFSFPKVECAAMVWFGMVPLLTELDPTRYWRSFRRAYCCGFIFFAVTLGWICYVTWAGALCLTAFLSLYFGLFGMLFVYFQRLAVTPRIFVLSACWAALEFTRAHLFSGFGWSSLGYTQSKNIWLIQIADTIGLYGISFLILMVNLLIFETWKARRFLPQASLIVASILVLVLVYGFCSVQSKDQQTVRVGLIQPNIPLVDDWNDAKRPWIVAKDIRLSRQIQDKKLDLIIWPETSLPGVITESPFLTNEIQATAQDMHTPLMIGSIAQDGDNYYNSAFLVGSDGEMHGRYDKIHLVIFGEYLPLRPILSHVKIIPTIDDFAFGKNSKIFSIGEKKFGVMICFEDTVEYLGQRLAQEGAQFFVNMTNDAWFLDTKQPFMHLQAAVFVCVENHRSLASTANTGISALVDPWGRITTMLTDSRGKKTFTEGTAWGEIPLRQEKTFYTKYGDVFTIFCFLCILMAVIFVNVRPRSNYAKKNTIG